MKCVTYLNAFIKIYLYWFYTLNKIGVGQVKETHLKKMGFISLLEIQNVKEEQMKTETLKEFHRYIFIIHNKKNFRIKRCRLLTLFQFFHAQQKKWMYSFQKLEY